MKNKEALLRNLDFLEKFFEKYSDDDFSEDEKEDFKRHIESIIRVERLLLNNEDD